MRRSSSRNGMMLVSLDGHSLRVNRPLVAMLGYTEEELRTNLFEDFTHPDDLDANEDLLRQAKAGEIDGYQLEKRFIHKEGRLVWGLVMRNLCGTTRDSRSTSLVRCKTSLSVNRLKRT